MFHFTGLHILPVSLQVEGLVVSRVVSLNNLCKGKPQDKMTIKEFLHFQEKTSAEKKP